MNGAAAWKYVNKGLLVILSIFVLATIASIIFLSYTLLKLDSFIGSTSRSVSTALELQTLLINLNEAETAARGYVITGQGTYLSSYDRASGDISAKLSAISADDGSYITEANIKKLQKLTEQKQAIMKSVVDTRRSGDQNASVAIITTGVSTQVMEQIRADIRSVSARIMNDIRPRQQRSHEKLQAALWVAGSVSIFVLGICIVLVWYFQYTIYRERALENTKNEFLSLASHQLRTPATNVKQYIGMLLEGYLGDLTGKQKDALKIAYKNNESEIRIMNDLLDVAKLDLQRIQLRKQRIDIVSVVRQVVRDYEQYVEARGQTMTLKAPPEVMAQVDRLYFKGVIEKLVDNAVKYSYDKTRISVKVCADADNNVFEVIIRDHGLGIGKREVPKLFMKFSRLTNEFSANTEGSGMGLYWVKQVMNMHGGSVKVASQEGRGSKFTVRAPIS